MNENSLSTRERVLQKIKSHTESLNSEGRAEELRKIMYRDDQADVNHPVHCEQFMQKLENAQATITVVKGRHELVQEIHRYVISHQIKSTITIANDDDLTELEWDGADVTTHYQPQSISVGVVYASLGIAETGTLLLKSSALSPTGMNFLPDHHIVVLNAENIVTTMEEAWKRVKSECGELPRTMNLISGPSRTADIEQTIQLGAHGPKYLHVILIKRDQASN